MYLLQTELQLFSTAFVFKRRINWNALCKVYADSIKHSPWEANGHPASQEIFAFYGTPSFITVFTRAFLSPCVKVRNELYLSRWGVLTPRPNPKL